MAVIILVFADPGHSLLYFVLFEFCLRIHFDSLSYMNLLVELMLH